MTRSVRLTLTHNDINTLMEALDNLDEDIKNHEGALDPMRGEIQTVEDKLQLARQRMYTHTVRLPP